MVCAMLLPFSSCKKENGPITKNSSPTTSPQPVNHEPLLLLTSSRIINDSLIDSIATRHNKVLNHAILDIDWTSSALSTEVQDFFIGYNDSDIDEIFPDREDVESYATNNSSYISNNVSSAVYSMIEEVGNYLVQKPNFSDLQNELSDHRGYAYSNFTGTDLDAALLYLAVVEKSAYFWMPESLGGLGTGWAFIEDYCDDNNLSTDLINWGEIGRADGYGAVAVLVRAWYLAAGGPLSWGAIVGAIGWGAAWGSGIEVFTQLMNADW